MVDAAQGGQTRDGQCWPGRAGPWGQAQALWAPRGGERASRPGRRVWSREGLGGAGERA